ncbi:hypothetical protein PTUN_b0343 [Pseudoalteromonas tunicata]|nr:hypothetical protein PTUN_b0343 [Pseudoalteromonas tunicata]
MACILYFLAVVIIDSAWWHAFDTVQSFDKVTLIKQPP